MKFEWDEEKAATNFTKHSVSFEEAATVFADPLAITFSDPDHSDNELRMLTFGITETGRYIIVSHTDRVAAMRIISARQMTTKERRIYETGK